MTSTRKLPIGINAAAVLQLAKYWDDDSFSDMTVRIIESVLRSPPYSHTPVDLRRPLKALRLTGSTAGPGSAETAHTDAEGQAAQNCKHEIHVSRIILAAGSGYFSTRFASGLSSSSSNNTYDLVVGPGEADAAKAVLQSIYTGKAPEQASLSEMILMFKMADRLQTSTMATFLEALTSQDISDWDWDAVVLVRAIWACSLSCCPSRLIALTLP